MCVRSSVCLLSAVLVCTAQEAATFRVATNLVPVTCNVTGRDGQPVLDMRVGDFVLLDNGKPQAVQYLWREDNVPLTIGLVVDISGSQGPFIREHRHTIIEFLRQVLRPQDQAFLVAVGSGVNLVTDLTHSIQDLQAGLARLDPRELFDPRNGSKPTDFGEQPCRPPTLPRFLNSAHSRFPSNFGCSTLLWNGLYSSAHLRTKSLGGRKAVIVLTDGLDAGSSRSLADVLEAAQIADTLIYTIRYAPSTALPQAAVARLEKRAQAGLRRLAEETGGRGFDDPKGDPFKIFDAIEKDLRNQYILAFTMPEAARDGKFHKLEVRSKRGGITVRARKGYQATPFTGDPSLGPTNGRE